MFNLSLFLQYLEFLHALSPPRKIPALLNLLICSFSLSKLDRTHLIVSQKQVINPIDILHVTISTPLRRNEYSFHHHSSHNKSQKTKEKQFYFFLNIKEKKRNNNKNIFTYSSTFVLVTNIQQDYQKKHHRISLNAFWE